MEKVQSQTFFIRDPRLHSLSPLYMLSLYPTTEVTAITSRQSCPVGREGGSEMARAIFVSLCPRFAAAAETVPRLNSDFLPPSPSLALDRTINGRPPDLALLTTEPSLDHPTLFFPVISLSFSSPFVAIFVCTVVRRFLPEHPLLRSIDEEPVHLICFTLLYDWKLIQVGASRGNYFPNECPEGSH
ncbi:hypothetical protein ACLOJK_036767 [Asimina triloba]